MKVMFHDDDCGEALDGDGLCPKCRFHPDMQSTAFREATQSERLTPGRTLLGKFRKVLKTPI